MKNDSSISRSIRTHKIQPIADNHNVELFALLRHDSRLDAWVLLFKIA